MKFFLCYNDNPRTELQKTVRITAPMKWKKFQTKDILKKFIKSYDYKLDITDVHLALMDDNSIESSKTYTPIPSDAPIANFIRNNDETLYIRHGPGLTQIETLLKLREAKVTCSSQQNVDDGGRRCARYGCGHAIPIGNGEKFGPCLYHQGAPIFEHIDGGMRMYWACCPARMASNLEELMKVRGCNIKPLCTDDEKQFMSEVTNNKISCKRKNFKFEPVQDPSSLASSYQPIRSNCDDKKKTPHDKVLKPTNKNDDEESDNLNISLFERLEMKSGLGSIQKDEDIIHGRDDILPRSQDESLDQDYRDDLVAPLSGNDEQSFEQENHRQVSTRCQQDGLLFDDPDSSTIPTRPDEGELLKSHDGVSTMIRFKRVLRSFGVDSVLYNTVVDDMKRDFELLGMDEDRLNATVKTKVGSMLLASFKAVADESTIEAKAMDLAIGDYECEKASPRMEQLLLSPSTDTEIGVKVNATMGATFADVAIDESQSDNSFKEAIRDFAAYLNGGFCVNY
jgi:CHORD